MEKMLLSVVVCFLSIDSAEEELKILQLTVDYFQITKFEYEAN